VELSQMVERIHLVPVLYLQSIKAFSVVQKVILFYTFLILLVWIAVLGEQVLDALRDLNQKAAEDFAHPETLTRIAQYELAYRMQASVPDVMDISNESKDTLDAYGAEVGGASLGNNCLLARRLAEKGVRFVQLFDWGWDYHGTNPKGGYSRWLDPEMCHNG